MVRDRAPILAGEEVLVVVEANECQRHTVAYEKFRIMRSGGSDEKHMNIMNIDKVQMMHILDQY